MYLDSDRRSPASPALWIPVVWVSLGASRMLSEWLGFQVLIASPDQYLAGSPIDRTFLSLLLAAAALVLVWRRRRSASFLRHNGPLLLFFLFGAASVLWSDYPMVTVRRWTKAAGNVVMVLVVLTDANPAQAIRHFFARVGFVLIPLSVLFITHFQHLGREYHWFTGQLFYTGVTTDKNSLGALCLVFGLAALWRVIEALRGRKNRRLRAVAPSAIVLVLGLWLFYMADSSTALVCFLLGSLVLLCTAEGTGVRPATSRALVGGLACAALAAYLLPGPHAWVLGVLGEDTTLTGRTRLWNDILRMEINPWLGTGFESFWLGDRARILWDKYFFRPTHSHNGYLETYVNLGWIGLGLLLWLIVSGYRHAAAGLVHAVPASSLKLTFLVVAVVYSITEAAFRVMHPVWIAFLFAIIAVPPDVPADSGPPASTSGDTARPVARERPGGRE
jgi:O-antigen ligase